MFVLALDIATQVGWASGRPGEEPAWGSRTFEGEHTGAVVGMFRHWLNARCYELRPSLVCFEAPYVPHAKSKVPMNAKTLRRLLGMCATAEAVAWELRIPCREATTLEISRFFIGTQRLARGQKKQATIEACWRYGWKVTNDNEADACALWHLAEFTLAPELAGRRGEGPLFIPERAAVADPEPKPPEAADGEPAVDGAGSSSETNARRNRGADRGHPDAVRVQSSAQTRLNAGRGDGKPSPQKRTPPVVPDRAALLFPPPTPGEASDGSPA